MKSSMNYAKQIFIQAITYFFKKPYMEESLQTSSPSHFRSYNSLVVTVLYTFGFILFTLRPFPVFAQVQEVYKYGVFEVSLNAEGSYTNPYLLMPGDNNTPGFVVGVFTGPNGEEISVDGFWDGGNTWKIRMAPTVEGTWSYKTVSSDAGLNGKTGTFTCIPSANKGFPRVDPSHPHHFMWDDASPFYWAPVTTMIAHFDTRDAQGGNRRMDDGTFQSLADVRASQGFTVTQWGYYGFNKPFFDTKEQRNEGGPPFTNYNPDLLNPSYHQFGDQRTVSLLDRGIIPQFNLGWPDQGILSSIGHTRLKRYWRYLIARYAAYNVTWNIFGETDEFGSSWLDIINDYGQLTRKWDPYDHLATTHLTGGPTSTLASQSWYDYIMLQRPTSDTSNYLSFGKPVINSEYGGYEDFQVTGEGLRPLIWDVRMRGGYLVYESWGNDPQSTGAQYASLNNLFFRNRTRFWLLEYHPELFGGKPGLVNPGQEYVIYMPTGGTITVDLSSVTDPLPVEWFNPRNGTYSGQTTTLGGGNRTFTAPDINDWVLHIGGVPTDSTSPTSPTNLQASPISDSRIDLTWTAASDPESGVISYNIYRNGVKVGSSTVTSFSDIGLSENTTFSYEISAVNGTGQEGIKSLSISATTLPDTTPPTILLVTSQGDPTKVVVVYSEPVDSISATETSNYISSNGITIQNALLEADQKTVILTTSPHVDGVSYLLSISKVRDKASLPNTIIANTQANYTLFLKLIVSNLTVASGRAYQIVENGLENNVAIQYIDRTVVFSTVPAIVTGKTYIKTANDDKFSVGTDFISFDVNQPVTIYVAHDDRYINKPEWLSSFTDTGEDLIGMGTVSLYAKDFPAGRITLGGNTTDGSGDNSMYTVVVRLRTTAIDTTPPAVPKNLRLLP